MKRDQNAALPRGLLDGLTLAKQQRLVTIFFFLEVAAELSVPSGYFKLPKVSCEWRIEIQVDQGGFSSWFAGIGAFL